MINIISKSYYSRLVSGPKKVVGNLIKGLELLGYPYVVNKRLDACQRLWIHDDPKALRQAADLPEEIKVLAGPNLFVLPGEINFKISPSRTVYLQHSAWVKSLWLSLGFKACPIEIWPVGVDTEQFKPLAEKKDLVLIYFKQRPLEDLKIIESLLASQRIKYQTLRYGHYRESNYQSLLAKTRYVIWLGSSESQGLALLEALSSNVSVLVCDIQQNDFLGNQILSTTESPDNRITSAPYFNSSCGIKLKGLEGLEQAIASMEKDSASFQPRTYVQQNLGLKLQAESFINFYQQHFNLPVAQGYSESVLKTGEWVNNSLARRFGFFVKDILKSLFV